ncbi:heat shock factor binding protein [Striga asiatica]|uniref:Heat shock factor binding protein n=1 Tax=Striga asiatica TaxID=4170 RepID=A0A5A7PDL4_STRAF|nr:heat shock factor binding protein [Striga asiatica]
MRPARSRYYSQQKLKSLSEFHHFLPSSTLHSTAFTDIAPPNNVVVLRTLGYDLDVYYLDGHDEENAKQSTADMTAFVQNLLQQMMGNRIDELEQSINDLRAEMGQEGSPSPSAPLKSKEESKSADDS